MYDRTTRDHEACPFVMNRMPASWDPFDPNALEAVDRDSDLGRELAIFLEEQEQEENSDRLTVE